jgi:hypothetical protein
MVVMAKTAKTARKALKESVANEVRRVIVEMQV